MHHRLPTERLMASIREARELTLAMVDDLSDAQLEVSERAEVNPLRWELGHVAYFYDSFVLSYLDPGHAALEGGNDLYNSFEVEHSSRWGLPLPSREETLRYMERVLEQVDAALGHGVASAEQTYVHLLAMLHECMHIEAFSYMRQTLGYGPPSLPTAQCVPSGRSGSAGALIGDVSVPGGEFMLGASSDQPFVFDNEKWAHCVKVEPFEIARAPVTNVEYAEFVAAGGYQTRYLWSTPGWIWRCRAGAEAPLYWSTAESGWLRRDYERMLPLEPHAPVSHVGWYEAQAYCRWAARRLPSEAEWTLAASAEPAASGRIGADKRRYPWGDQELTAERANLNFHALACVDVAAHPSGDSAFGCRQMLGNVWEWTSSAFYPFPGYVVDPPYLEYSAPWFGDRKVLKGGGWATSACLATNGYRNFFTPDRRDVVAGFRTCALER